MGTRRQNGNGGSQLDLFAPDTLSVAKMQLQRGLTDGIKCPCCERWAKRYRRPMSKTMAKCHIWLCRAAGAGGIEAPFIDVPKKAPRFVLRSKQLSLLRWWDLIERAPRPEGNDKSRFSGLWRPTELGWEWYSNPEATIHNAVATVFGEAEGPAEDAVQITLRQALRVGEDFDFREVFNPTPASPGGSA